MRRAQLQVVVLGLIVGWALFGPLVLPPAASRWLVAGPILVLGVLALAVSYPAAQPVPAPASKPPEPAARTTVLAATPEWSVALPDTVILCAGDGTIRWANRDLAGAPAASLAAHSLISSADPHDQPALRTLLQAGDSLRSAELSLLTPEGTRVRYLLHAGALPNGDRLVLARRLSGSTQAEWSVREQAVAGLARGLAHDLNNLLTIVQGNLELIRSMAPAISCGGELGEVAHGAERITQLAVRLTTLARRTPVRRLPTELRRLVCESLLALGTRQEDLTRWQVAEGEYPINADERLLRMALEALLCSVATDLPGSGMVTIAFGEHQVKETWQHRFGKVDPGEYLKLTITISGVVVPEAMLARFFDPYFNVFHPEKSSNMNLALAAAIFREHLGAMLCENGPEGLVITGLLGRAAVGTSNLTNTARFAVTAAANGPPPPTKGTILTVDDDSTLRVMTKRILERDGYKVLAAADCTEAVRLSDASREPINLLLTDLLMPGGNGTDIAVAVCRRHPEARLLFTSGMTESAVGQLPAGLPPVEFLSKPFSGPELVAKVHQVLNGKA